MSNKPYDPVFNPNPPQKKDDKDSQPKPIEGDPAFNDDGGNGLIDNPSDD